MTASLNQATTVTYEQVLQQTPHYQPRPVQHTMMQQIERALREKHHLMVEAGTGSGKSFGYLLPALLHGAKPVVISTGTIALQEQLINKDIPLLQQALYGKPDHLTVKLAKGRSNYLCIRKLDEINSQLSVASTGKRQQASQQLSIDTLKTSLYEGWEGDKALLDFAVDPSLWREVASETEDCLGWRCRFYDQNPYRMAREALGKADIIVANHAIYCQDLVTNGGLLPAHDVVIFDEAHTLANYATNAFSSRIGQHRTSQLMERIRKRLMPLPDPLLWQLKEAEATLLHWALQRAGSHKEFRLQGDLSTFFQGATTLKQAIEEVQHWVDGLSVEQLPPATSEEQAEKRSSEQTKLLEQLQTLADDWALFLHEGPLGLDGLERVNWVSCDKQYLQLSFISTPLQVGEILKQRLWTDKTAILTSATLSVKHQLQYFKNELGLVGTVTDPDTNQPTPLVCKDLVLPSPFSYQNNCLYYIPTPQQLPELPTDEAYWSSLLTQLEQLLEASQGRAFILFTSYQAMTKVAQQLIPRVFYPIRQQGDLPRGKLVDWFKKTPNSVLLATATFWEGIDIPGESLSLVVIDRLPFVTPDDPVHQAKVERMKQTGADWFGGYTLPQAAIKLKQGVGRLIRSVDDRGVVALLDTRLRTKGYGNTLLQSLPKAPLTHSLEEVQQFFKADIQF
jgi:ATP-dependent DNA helicase DinG